MNMHIYSGILLLLLQLLFILYMLYLPVPACPIYLQSSWKSTCSHNADRTFASVANFPKYEIIGWKMCVYIMLVETGENFLFHQVYRRRFCIMPSDYSRISFCVMLLDTEILLKLTCKLTTCQDQ